MSEVNLVLPTNVDANMVYQQRYAKGGYVIPDLDGEFTVVALQVIYEKSKSNYLSPPKPGQVTEVPCIATWIAVDEVAAKAVYEHQQSELDKLVAKQKLVLPPKPKLITGV